MLLAEQLQLDLKNNGWFPYLEHTLCSESSIKLRDFLQEAYAKGTVYPLKSQIFRSIQEVPFGKVKIVIIGQDPYVGPNQANGLAFAVNKGHKRPPSLRNIFIELAEDLGVEIPDYSSTLEGWAKQGVLLLNSVLTVDKGEKQSHSYKGWEPITDCIVSSLSKNRSGIVFLLWGEYAKFKCKHIDLNKHAVLTAGHPSPLSARYFWGCKHFSKANQILVEKFKKEPIKWELIDEGESNGQYGVFQHFASKLTKSARTNGND